MTTIHAKHWPDVPFAPRRFPFFYGWVILGVSTIGTVSSIPGQTMGVGVFNEYISEVLGLSSMHLSSAYAVGTIISSFCLPFAGRMLDSVGARAMVVFSSVGLGLSVLGLSACDSIAGLGGVPRFVPAIVTICLCFLALRFFGQGCQTLVPRVMIGKWFEARRGLATGIAGVFVAFAFNGGTIGLNAMVVRFGWRETCWISAAIVGLGMTALGWLLYRDSPEECGLHMDGVSAEAHAKAAREAGPQQRDFTRSEAVRTLAFWAYALGPASHALVSTAFFFFLSDFGGEHGMDRDSVYALLWAMPFVSVAANFTGAWLSDRIDLRYCLLAMVAGQAVGSLGLAMLGTPLGKYLLVGGYGVAGGLFVVVLTVAFPRFFGRAHLGAISGLNTSVMVFASAIGPILFDIGRKATGSFTVVLLLSCLMPVAVGIMGLRARDPQRNQASA